MCLIVLVLQTKISFNPNDQQMKHAFLILALAILISCGKNSESFKAERNSDYELVKVDSFTIDNLTRVKIIDYSETENIFLGYSEVQNDILEISPQGEIIKRVNLSGDGPGKLGSWVPLGLSFGPENKRVFQLPFQLVTYDQAYEIQENIRIQSPLPVRTSAPLGQTSFFMENGLPRYLVGPTGFLSAHLLIYNDEGRDTLQNFTLLYPETGETKSVIPYEEDSYYKKTPNIYMSLMGKSFFISEGKLVVLQGLSESIQVYDLKDFSLIKNIPFEHSTFLKYDPIPIGTSFDDPRTNQLASMAGRNMRILQLSEDFWMIRYYQGINNAEFELRNSEERPYRFFDATDKIKFILLKNESQIAELGTPEGTMLFALGKNKILFQEKASEEVEEEFTKYSIYELKKVE